MFPLKFIQQYTPESRYLTFIHGIQKQCWAFFVVANIEGSLKGLW